MMSNTRQRPLSPSDERFLIVRSMVVRCASGLRTLSATPSWHRLVSASSGVMLVSTAQGRWATPPGSAVWVPSDVRAELETSGQTSMEMLYVRESRAAWCRGGVPEFCRQISVGPLLQSLILRAASQPALDRRIAWHAALAQLLLHEVREGAVKPVELLWPTDPRAARIAALLQSDPSDNRRIEQLCRGQGASARTIQRLFPIETGATFEEWRIRLRMLAATKLLAEGRKIDDVANACGYSGASAFGAAFLRVIGTPPGRFRAGGALRLASPQ